MSIATPTGLKLTPGANAIVVTWNISGEGLGAQLLHFRAKGTTSWTTVELKSTVRSYAITGLPVAGFEVQVRALVAGGLAQGTATPLVPEPPPPPPPPIEPTTIGLLKGWNGGGWGSTEFGNLKTAKASCVRLENAQDTLSYTNNGQRVIYLQSGAYGSGVSHFTPGARQVRHRKLRGLPVSTVSGTMALLELAKVYLSGGVKAINAESFAASAVATVKAHPDIIAYEALNEPGGDWFWGPNASSAENAAAYCHLLKNLREAFNAQFGSKAPLLFASFDGGHAGDNTWGKRMLAADPKVVSYVDAFTEHPYDGSGANPASTLVHFGAVEEAHKLTGKPIAITEYGRPTINGTGDSPKSTPEQQANALAAMIRKSREVGYVPAVCIYGYRDGRNAQGYGIYNENDSAKPAVAAFAAA